MVICIILSVISEIPEVIYLEVNTKSTCEIHDIHRVLGFAYGVIISQGIKDTTFFVVSMIVNYLSYKELYKKRDDQQCLLTKHQEKEKKQTFKTIVVMSVVIMVTVFPRDLLHIIYTSSWISPPGINLTKALLDTNSSLQILHVSNSICNIFIYARLHSQFRRHIIKPFRSIK